MSHVSEEQLSSLLAGFLSERRSAQLARHLARGCRECQATIASAPSAVLPGPETLARLVEALGASPHACPPAEQAAIWADIVARLPDLGEPEPAFEPAPEPAPEVSSGRKLPPTPIPPAPLPSFDVVAAAPPEPPHPAPARPEQAPADDDETPNFDEADDRDFSDVPYAAPQPFRRMAEPARRFPWNIALALVVGIVLIAFVPRFMTRKPAPATPEASPAATAAPPAAVEAKNPRRDQMSLVFML